MRKITFGLLLLLVALCGSIAAQTAVRAVVVNEFANVRIIPEIGADVITTVSAGYVFEFINGRSSNNEWLRVDFNGEEGWVHVVPLTILQGDINTLPVADPRTIPYGGFESPRAGFTSANSNITGRLANSGVRVRAGPSTGYPVLADAPRYTVFPLLGRNASSTWLQVNFEGTLGWVATRHVELSAALSLLPIDGIVADSIKPSQAVAEDFVATLRLMLARLDLAQPSLDEIRASWTDSALTGRAYCRPYPARPSDYNIPNPLLAAYYNTLNPLMIQFNDAMYNVRYAIDLFIDACNQPGLQNPVGQATVIGALNTVALADKQFAELRKRLNELIPPEREIGEGECLLSFRSEVDILPVITLETVVLDNFSPRRIATGYCIDLLAGMTVQFETLQLQNSNAIHLLSVSPFDNPTNFLAIGRGSDLSRSLVVGPLIVPENGRYLIILSNIAELTAPLNGQFALLVSVPPAGLTGARLQEDPNTGQVTIGLPGSLLATPNPNPGTGGVPPFLQTQQAPPFGQTSLNDNTSVVCPGVTLTCEQLASCEQAYACMNAGNFGLDPDEDGVPCEVLRCPAYP